MQRSGWAGPRSPRRRARNASRAGVPALHQHPPRDTLLLSLWLPSWVSMYSPTPSSPIHILSLPPSLPLHTHFLTHSYAFTHTSAMGYRLGPRPQTHTLAMGCRLQPPIHTQTHTHIPAVGCSLGPQPTSQGRNLPWPQPLSRAASTLHTQTEACPHTEKARRVRAGRAVEEALGKKMYQLSHLVVTQAFLLFTSLNFSATGEVHRP